MSTKSKLLASIAGLALISLAGWFSLKDSESQSDAAPTVERTRDQLELRKDQLFEPDATEPFTGKMVAFYPEQKYKVMIEIMDGRPHGMSRGWHDNGQLEVEEPFVAGSAHGLRTRWHENGEKRSEAQIVNGVISGSYVQWHDNGQKAAEATIVNGQPHGLSLGWHRSGAPKSRVELNGGEIVSREYWEDTPH